MGLSGETEKLRAGNKGAEAGAGWGRSAKGIVTRRNPESSNFLHQAKRRQTYVIYRTYLPYFCFFFTTKWPGMWAFHEMSDA